MMLTKGSKVSRMNPAADSTALSDVDCLWTVAEAAEFLQLSSGCVYHLVSSNEVQS